MTSNNTAEIGLMQGCPQALTKKKKTRKIGKNVGKLVAVADGLWESRRAASKLLYDVYHGVLAGVWNGGGGEQ